MYNVAVITKHPIVYTGIKVLLDESPQSLNAVLISNSTELERGRKFLRLKLVLYCEPGQTEADAWIPFGSILFHFPGVPVAVCANQIEVDRLLTYFALGVKGYLSMGDSSKDLTDCLNAVLDGCEYVSMKAALLLLESIKGNNYHMLKSLRERRLTTRESQIAKCLHTGMRVKEIASNLDVRPSTVIAAKYRVFKKMKVSSIRELRALR